MNERLKKAFNQLKVLGLISNQEDLAKQMNYARSSISKALNGYEDYMTDNFIKEFCNTYQNVFNLNWLLTGEGEMLNSRPSNLSNSFVGDGNKNIQVGHGSKTIRTNESDKEVVSALEKQILILEGELKSKDKEIEGLKNSLTDKERLVQVLMNNLTDKSL